MVKNIFKILYETLMKRPYSIVWEFKNRKFLNFEMEKYHRIYHYHIRKTGGTSINEMFIALTGCEDAHSKRQELCNCFDNRLLINDRVYVNWNIQLLNEGKYFYGFSHHPFHSLNLPENTFTFTCFRDPVKRVLSYYNMLMYYKRNNIKHPGLKISGKWLGDSFDEFLKVIPKHRLMDQLFMFSSELNVNEAYDNVSGLSYYFFNDDFKAGIEELNNKLDLRLKYLHTRKAQYKYDIKDSQLDYLKDLLYDEYDFLNKLKSKTDV